MFLGLGSGLGLVDNFFMYVCKPTAMNPPRGSCRFWTFDPFPAFFVVLIRHGLMENLTQSVEERFNQIGTHDREMISIYGFIASASSMSSSP